MQDQMNTASTAIAQSVNQVERSRRVAESSESGVTESGVAPTAVRRHWKPCLDASATPALA